MMQTRANCAEVVRGMVLVQLAYPGAPVFHSNYISLMHPRTGGYVAELATPLSWMEVQMAHAWGVPNLGGGSGARSGADRANTYLTGGH